MKERLLLDTDIGSDVDDAHALLYALNHPNISLEGVTTMYGKCDIRAKVAKKIIDYAGKSIPVHCGEAMPMRSGYASIWHTGREGEGVLTETELALPLSDMGVGNDAVGFLVDKIMSNPGEYNIAMIGCSTNVAKAYLMEPKIADNLKHMYIMAGAFSFPHKKFDPENIYYSYDVEHNIAMDVKAARIVLNDMNTPKTLFPIDVTSQVPVDRRDFELLNDEGKSKEAVKALTDVWFDYRDTVFMHEVKYTCMHDPLTIASIVHDDLVETVRMPIHLTSKGAVMQQEDSQVINVAYKADFEKFRENFLRTILS
tara:strand:- start:46269 stop:47204 length:936 start_codon:yes stop_codon:yes gene_type:complete